MRISFLFLFASSLCLQAQTVDEIIDKCLAARGGLAKLKAVETQRLTGHLTLGPDLAGPMRVTMKRPGRMREEVTLNGEVSIRTLAGTSGWKIMGTQKEAVPLSADDVRNMSGGADYDGPLVDYRAKGNKVEYAGKSTVEGKEVYKLIVTMKDGQVRNDYIDCKTLLEIKWEGKLTFNGTEYRVESYFRDYRKVDGVMYAFHIDSETLGTPYKQKILFEKVEVNPAVDEEQFGKPVL
jgi:hypothetical protein